MSAVQAQLKGRRSGYESCPCSEEARLYQVLCLLLMLSVLQPWCRAAVLEALKPLGTLGKGVYGGDAIYIWAKLPAGRVSCQLPRSYPSLSAAWLCSYCTLVVAASPYSEVDAQPSTVPIPPSHNFVAECYNAQLGRLL